MSKANGQTLEEQLADHEHSFELRHKADMRAIERWRKAHPERELVMPDHADLCVWLLEERDRLLKALGRLRAEQLATGEWATHSIEDHNAIIDEALKGEQ